MQTMGLNAVEMTAFATTLRSSHERRVVVSVTTLEGTPLATITPVVIDGQVVVDQDADVTRSATLPFLDPERSLTFDTNSPDDGAMFADRAIRILYSVHVPALSRWVSVPIFHGPITRLERTGESVSVEAQGMEAMSLDAIWSPLTLNKGARKTDAIRAILTRTGERRFDIPTLPAQLPAALSLDRYAVPWTHAKAIAAGMNYQLFYPGTGTATMRTLPGNALWTFRTGDGGDVVSEVGISTTLEDFANVIVVTGSRPKGATAPVSSVATVPADHPLSPKRLGRNGVYRHIVQTVDDESIRSAAEALTRAKAELSNRILSTVEVSFDSLPIPHLDAGDLVRVQTDTFTTTFRLAKFSIPLGSGSMPVGYLRKTTANVRRIRNP